jgi:hypothetical protein
MAMDDTTVRASEDASSAATRLVPLHRAIEANGFAFVPANELRPMFDRVDALVDWTRFAASWNDLRLDTYLPDGHRYRYRRHATFSRRTGDTACRLEPHRPHYQGIDYNPLVGGIDRWFEPIEADIAESPALTAILAFCCRLFGALRPGTDWLIECHQFRIEARRDTPGRPTPEGVHRDGVDYVLVLLINRTNIESGTTTVHDLDGRLLGSFTLTTPLDAALVDDSRVKHGVTAVTAIDPAMPAYRDVLVVTFRARPAGIG